MKVVALNNVIRKDVPIYYRRLFSGTVVLELVNKSVERAIDFMIETMPTGVKEISVTMTEPVDYPVVPLMKEIKKFINETDDSGKLPI